jgi:hypothetical protein
VRPNAWHHARSIAPLAHSSHAHNLCLDQLSVPPVDPQLSHGTDACNQTRSTALPNTYFDLSLAFAHVACTPQYTHGMRATMMISLLQPPPEVYNLFDDLCLMADG